MSIEEITLLVQLTSAKVEILKLKADAQAWQCWVDQDTKDKLEATLVEIDEILKQINPKQ